MPDTRPITESFPWLTARYSPVFSGQNALTTHKILTNDTTNTQLTDDSGRNILTADAPVYLSPGDLYRYI